MTTGLILAALLAATPGAAHTVMAPAARENLPPSQSAFSCQDGHGLTARFASRDAQLVAIVDAGNGPHALPLQPWDGGAPRITWSDGVRTLTWNPGVQIMWMEGAVHRTCGRSGGHKH